MRRLLHGVAANGYGQAVTIGTQLLSVPVLIRAWGSEGYGLWVLLTAIPTALAFADGGLVVASGTAMAMAAGRGDTAAAGALYRATAGRLCRTVGGVAALALAAILLLPVARLAPVLTHAGADPRLILATLAAVVLTGTVASLPGAALRAGGHYPASVAAATTTRLAEALAILVAAAAGGGPLAAATGWLAVRVGGTAWQIAAAHRRLPWLTRADIGAALPDLRPLLAPALASVAMPAAFAVGLQGVTVAIGLALSPVAVAQFAATRALARAAVQGSGLVNHAIMPELSRLAGRGDAAAVAAAVRLNRRICGPLLGVAWAATLLFGPWLVTAWTHGRIAADPLLIALLGTAALLHGLWLGAANCLLAVNRQGEFAWLFLGSALAVALLAWPVAAAGGLHGVAALTLAGEAVMAARLSVAARRPALSPRIAASLPA